MSILKITHPKIETKGEDGKPNGYLVPKKTQKDLATD